MPDTAKEGRPLIDDAEVDRVARLMHDAFLGYERRHFPRSADIKDWDRLSKRFADRYRHVARVLIEDLKK